MKNFFRTFYLTRRFFYLIFGLGGLFFVSFWLTGIYPWIWILVLISTLIFLGDVVSLYKNTAFIGSRILPDKLSNGDYNTIELNFVNRYDFQVHVEIIDEIPLQFQKRNFLKKLTIPAKKEVKSEYVLRPVNRGEYIFGNLNCYISGWIGLVRRRYLFQHAQKVKVYPSIQQMQKYDFLAVDNKLQNTGLKKIRRIGHTMEFEQVKEYVRGDDIRTVNWKATAKHGQLMVNQYQDKRSQPVYSILNIGRTMKMPFEGLTLLDYAINSTLAFSNIALKKGDKVGLLSYEREVSNFLLAQSSPAYLNKILETLYNIKTGFYDTDLGLLYAHLQRKVNQRSLIMLYTNFEHYRSMKKKLPVLRAIAKKHLLVVIFFENTELKALLNDEVDTIPGIYDQAIAREFKAGKQKIVRELRQNGIQSILTTPAGLTVNTVNKYLELKAKGLF